MAVRCQHCGNELQDPGGSLEGRHCGICGSPNLVRTGPQVPPPDQKALGGLVIGAVLGALAGGPGGMVVGGLLGAIVSGSAGEKR